MGLVTSKRDFGQLVGAQTCEMKMVHVEVKICEDMYNLIEHPLWCPFHSSGQVLQMIHCGPVFGQSLSFLFG